MTEGLTCNLSDIIDFVGPIVARNGECTVVIDGVTWIVENDDIIRYTYRSHRGDARTLHLREA